MDTNFGCKLTLPAPDEGQTTLYLVDVEQQFLGLSLTERRGIESRRVCAELHDLDQIAQLRDSLTAFLSRRGR